MPPVTPLTTPPAKTPHPGHPRCLAIVPAFNERNAIVTLVQRLRRTLPGYDILVIDDGSTDDTARQVPPAAAALVSLPFNLGIGGAMQTGYRYAALHGYDVAVQVDGDGQHRPSEVLRLVDHLLESDSDLAIGSRFLGDSTYRQTPFRRAGSGVLRTLIKLLTGLTITDCTSGFRAANKKVIDAFAHWYPEDYPEPEIILLLHRAGFAITELPVRMRQRRAGVSSIRPLAGVFYVIKVTACLLLDLLREPWPRGKVLDHADPDSADHARRLPPVPPAGPPDPLRHPAGPGWRAHAPGHRPAPRVQA